MTRCRFWYAYQLGDDKRYSFKLHGQFKQGLKVGDEIKEFFGGRLVVYKMITVDEVAKIYGVDYLYDIEY